METYSHDVTPPPAISQLPTELLIQVLEWALPSTDLVSDRVGDRLHSYMRILYTLRLVGKRWQEIIDGTPTFWTFVLSTLPSHVKDTTILRSNNGPLAIVYSTAFWNPAEHRLPADFLQGIVKHTRHRWSAYCGPIVRKYLETPAPLLQHVSLNGRFDGSEPLDLLGGYSTSLRHVELSHLSIPWKKGLFTHLHVLKLTAVGQKGLTTGHLLDFLYASPRLEVLELTGVSAVISKVAYSSAITLSHLRSIEVRTCGYDLAKAVLSHIRAPSCIEFDVSLGVYERSLPNFLEDALQNFREPLRAIHKHVGASEIILGGGAVLWETAAGRAEDHRFCLSIDCATPASCIPFVKWTLDGDSGLSWHFDHQVDISEALLETIAPMRCVTKVKVGGSTYRGETGRILRFLGKAYGTQPLLPLLPGLRELELTSVAWGAEDLIKMVQSRFETLSWDTLERSRLSIAISREALSWVVHAAPILDYVMLSKIRDTNGIESVRFSDLGNGKGMVGITWDEETSKPLDIKRKLAKELHAAAVPAGQSTRNLTFVVVGTQLRTNTSSVPTGTDQNATYLTYLPTNGLGRHSAFQPEPARLTMETYSHDVTPPPAISQLPTELLIQVLKWALPSTDLVSDRVGDRLHSYMRILYTLRLVGKRWQDIIDGTSTFWTFVLSTLPSHVNEAIILRSNNGPLAIVYSPGRLWAMAFLQGIKDTRDRWSAYRGPIVRGYFDTPAPLLQHVSIDGRLDSSERLDLLGGYSTSLRHVDLFCLSIRWKIGLFTHLHALKLECVGQNSLTTGHLLGFLHASPRLEVLRLITVDAAISDLPDASAITLSHLRSIVVGNCMLGVVAAILSHIRAPSCIEFWVELCEVGGPNLSNFLEDNLGHFRGPLRTIHKHAGLSEIILEGREIHWQTPAERRTGRDHKFFLLIKCAAQLSCLQFVQRTLCRDPGLNFRFGDVEDISETLSETFASMQCVTKVEIEGGTDREDVRRILLFLGEVCSTQPLLPSLPGLRELKLTSVEWDAEDLMKMVDSRFDTPSRDTVELSRLSIVMSREAFSWAVSPPPTLNYVVLSKIRNSNGIESVRFSDLGNGKGMLGITWDEETSKPVWG